MKDLITQDKLLLELQKAGINDEFIVEELKRLLKVKTVKWDKNGNMHEVEDGNLRLKVLELFIKLKGPKQGAKNNHLHLDSKSLDKLLGK